MTEIKDAKLRDLNVRAERAQACFEEGEKELFRPDGSKLFSDSEHGERVRALEQERNGVLGDIEQQAKEVRMAVATEIERIENADPADALAPSELEQANLKRAFAVDAAETLDAEAFGKRLESVLAAGDKGSIFAYYMAGQRKSKDRDSRVSFRDVLAEMGAALGGKSRAADVEAAKRRQEEAVEVESLAHNLQSGSRNAYGTYAKRTYGHVYGRR